MHVLIIYGGTFGSDERGKVTVTRGTGISLSQIPSCFASRGAKSGNHMDVRDSHRFICHGRSYVAVPSFLRQVVSNFPVDSNLRRREFDRHPDRSHK